MTYQILYDYLDLDSDEFKLVFVTVPVWAPDGNVAEYENMEGAIHSLIAWRNKYPRLRWRIVDSQGTELPSELI